MSARREHRYLAAIERQHDANVRWWTGRHDSAAAHVSMPAPVDDVVRHTDPSRDLYCPGWHPNTEEC